MIICLIDLLVDWLIDFLSHPSWMEVQLEQ